MQIVGMAEYGGALFSHCSYQTGASCLLDVRVAAQSGLAGQEVVARLLQAREWLALPRNDLHSSKRTCSNDEGVIPGGEECNAGDVGRARATGGVRSGQAQLTRSQDVPAAQPQLGTAGLFISRPTQGVSAVRGATKHLVQRVGMGLEGVGTDRKGLSRLWVHPVA